MKIKPISSKAIASTATFAVIYFIFRMLPTFPMIGVSGSTFTLADILAPLYGIILGPYIGAASIILGTFLSIAAGRPMVFLGLDFLPATINAVMIGFLVKRWKLQAIILNCVLFIIFLLHPYTAVLIPLQIPALNFDAQFFFAWLHLAALIILISPISNRAVDWLNGKSTTRIGIALLLLSLIGTMAQHLTGNLLYETVWGMFLGKAPEAFKLLWYAIFWIYPIERTFIIIVTAIIGLPILRITGKWLRGRL